MNEDSIHIGSDGRSWSISALLASSLPRRVATRSVNAIWVSKAFDRVWGKNTPSPHHILLRNEFRVLRGMPLLPQEPQHSDARPHAMRIMDLIDTLDRGERVPPLVVGPDGTLWDGVHRLCAFRELKMEACEVIDFSGGVPPATPCLADWLSPSLLRGDTPARIAAKLAVAPGFPHLALPQVLRQDRAEAIAAVLGGVPWRLSETYFYSQYECPLLDADEFALPPVLLEFRSLVASEEFGAWMAEVTGSPRRLELVDLALHKSVPGQQIGIHTDCLGSEEMCRLTIHLNSGWQPGWGGYFVTLSDKRKDKPLAAVMPEFNTAVLFRIGEHSYHCVTEVTGERDRYSLVLSFRLDSKGPELPLLLQQAIRSRYLWLKSLQGTLVTTADIAGRHLSRCSVEHCRGACCKDGAGLNPKEADLLRVLQTEASPAFQRLGIDLSQALAEDGGGHWRTGLTGDGVEGRRCALQLADGRCSLQVYATETLGSPYALKPIACVMYPLRSRTQAKAKILSIDAPTSEAARAHLECGREQPCGESAVEVLKPELDYLSGVWRRNLREEIRQGRDVADRILSRGYKVLSPLVTTPRHQLWMLASIATGTLGVLKLPTQTGGTARLLTEAAWLEKLKSAPGIIRLQGILDLRQGEQGLFLEYIAGSVDLREWLRKSRDVATYATVFRQLLNIVLALGQADVFHGDFCPRNILVTPKLHVTLIDFENASAFSKVGYKTGGSPGFAAPELYLGGPWGLSPKTESFAVGAMLFHALNRIAVPKVSPLDFDKIDDGVASPLRSVAWHLLGDPLRHFDPVTRASASDAIKMIDAISSRRQVDTPEFAPSRDRQPVQRLYPNQPLELQIEDDHIGVFRVAATGIWYEGAGVPLWKLAALIDMSSPIQRTPSGLRVGCVEVRRDGQVSRVSHAP